MTKVKDTNIVFCSTSRHETDRRMIRIIASLTEIGYMTTWISRSQSREQEIKESHTKHIIVKTICKRGPIFYLEFNVRIFFQLLKIKSNIVCAVDLDTIPGVCLAKFFNRAVITFDAHEIFYEVPELSGRPLKKGLWKFVAKTFLPLVKHNYTVNKSLATHYSENYNQAYKVVRNIPDVVISDKAEKPYGHTLAYLGVLNKGRGLEIAIEAMHQLRNYKLLIIGEGDLSTELREQASGLDNVQFLGFIPPAEVMKNLSQADIGLNMLVADSLNYKLSLANKFFDYMHAGLPSINMAYPEYKNILQVHEVGVMVKNYSVEALTGAINRIENSYPRLRKNCLHYSPHYTWSEEKKKVQQLYETISQSL